MGRAKRRRITSSRSFRTPKTGALIAMIALLFLIVASIMLSFFMFNQHLVLSEGFFWLAASGFVLFFSIVLLHSSMEKFMDKIILPIAIIGSLAFSAVFARTAVQLFLDKSAYEAMEYRVVKGLPSHVYYDGSKNGPDYVSAITIQNTRVKVSHLYITEKEFLKTLHNKPLKLDYLPNSKFVIHLEEHQPD